MLNWFKSNRNSKLERKVKDLEAVIEGRDRTIRIQQAEIDSLAAVIARDRLRVTSETAVFARTIAENQK